MHIVTYHYLFVIVCSAIIIHLQIFNLCSVYAYIFKLRENRAYILILNHNWYTLKKQKIR
jgi:hypothetical protein